MVARAALAARRTINAKRARSDGDEARDGRSRPERVVHARSGRVCASRQAPFSGVGVAGASR